MCCRYTPIASNMRWSVLEEVQKLFISILINEEKKRYKINNL